MNFWIIFITGLTVGGLTCLAVQGGLLASVIAAREVKESNKGKNKLNPFLPTIAFLASKLIVYVLFGLLLGAFGKTVGINQQVQTIMQFVAGIYMIAIACNLLNIHPIFRYFVIQPPRFLLKKIKMQSRSNDLFAPIILGAMTLFIPCGTTLAMEALAISSANPFVGAAVMGTFILGTTPLFFGIGWLTTVLGDNFRTRFIKVAAVAVFYLGIVSIFGALTAQGIKLPAQPHPQEKLYSEESIKQNIVISVTSEGYSPNYVKVKKNTPVTMTITSKDAYSCALAFRIPSLGISKNLHPTETYTFSFTPKESGIIDFSCSMGMYTGEIEVI